MRSYHDDIVAMERLGHRAVGHPQRVPRKGRWWRLGRRSASTEPGAAPWEAYEDIAWRCSTCGRLITRSRLIAGDADPCRGSSAHGTPA